MDLHTGTPFWKTQNDVPFSFPELERDEVCEVAILGGGITGALVAHTLSKNDKKILVLEGRKIGQGSTIASTALLSHATDKHLRALAAQIGLPEAVRVYRSGLEAVDKIESITRELGTSCGFERKSSLYFASTDQDAIELREECKVRVDAGLPASFWDEEQVRSNCAVSAPAAIWSAGDAQIDAYAITLATLKRLIQQEVGVFENACATSIQRSGTKFIIETNSGRTIRADHLVLATGYESQKYLPAPQAELISTFVIASKPLPHIPGWPQDCLIWETARPYIYMRRTADGHILVGGEDERGAVTHDDPELVRKKSRALRDRFQKIFPNVSLEPYCEWGGTFVDSPDGLPYIGMHKDFSGAWFALGYGGNGITFAVIAAEIIAAGLCGTPSPDAFLYRFDRAAT